MREKSIKQIDNLLDEIEICILPAWTWPSQSEGGMNRNIYISYLREGILIPIWHHRPFIITKPRVQFINRLAIIRKEGGKTSITNQYIDLGGDRNKIPGSIIAVLDPLPSTLYEVKQATPMAQQLIKSSYYLFLSLHFLLSTYLDIGKTLVIKSFM